MIGNLEWKDVLGHEIKPGDTVAYATQAGSSSVMKFGRVIELSKEKDRFVYSPTNGSWKVKAVTVERIIDCRWVDDQSCPGGKRRIDRIRWALQRNGNRIALYCHAMIVMAAHSIPEEARKLLDEKTPPELLEAARENEAVRLRDQSMALDALLGSGRWA